MRYFVFLFLLHMVSIQAQPDTDAPLQQQNIDTEEDTKIKIGIKFSMGGHSFTGNAFDNAKLKYGFGMGLYNILHMNKAKTTNFHWEIDATFKGSRFSKTNDTAFSKISLSYIELPLYLSLQIANTEKKQPLHLLIGVQFGYLFRSSLNKQFGKYSSVKTDLPFNRGDISPAIGLRKEIGSGMSMQFCFKIGLMNIYNGRFKDRVDHPDLNNPNFDYRDITPALKDGSHKAKNIGFEFSLMF